MGVSVQHSTIPIQIFYYRSMNMDILGIFCVMGLWEWEWKDHQSSPAQVWRRWGWQSVCVCVSVCVEWNGPTVLSKVRGCEDGKVCVCACLCVSNGIDQQSCPRSEAVRMAVCVQWNRLPVLSKGKEAVRMAKCVCVCVCFQLNINPQFLSKYLTTDPWLWAFCPQGLWEWQSVCVDSGTAHQLHQGLPAQVAKHGLSGKGYWACWLSCSHSGTERPQRWL